jgi:hypothetical protein
MLFEERLGYEVYRPIGMDWYREGFWNVYPAEATAVQYLGVGSQPMDGTVPLNQPDVMKGGVYRFRDPGASTMNRACTLEYFKDNDFELVLSSIPEHVVLFKSLILKYQPGAHHIQQMGNQNWLFEENANVLASVKPKVNAAHTVFYHQEFDTSVFCPTPPLPTKKVSAFIHCMVKDYSAWVNFIDLEERLPDHEFRSYGGQCRDGSLVGAQTVAHTIQESSTVIHLKTGGDGFGHAIYNAFAVGRPMVLRRSHLHGTLAEELLVDGAYLDLDTHTAWDAAAWIADLSAEPDRLVEASCLASESFVKCVNYDAEASEVSAWLETLR